MDASRTSPKVDMSEDVTDATGNNTGKSLMKVLKN